MNNFPSLVISGSLTPAVGTIIDRDAIGRRTGIHSIGNSHHVLADFVYQYDALSRVISLDSSADELTAIGLALQHQPMGFADPRAGCQIVDAERDTEWHAVPTSMAVDPNLLPIFGHQTVHLQCGIWNLAKLDKPRSTRGTNHVKKRRAQFSPEALQLMQQLGRVIRWRESWSSVAHPRRVNDPLRPQWKPQSIHLC